MPIFDGLFESDDDRLKVTFDGYIDLFSPKSFAEAVDITKNLLKKRASIVNISKIEDQQRFLDFMSGATLASGSTMNRISKDVVIYCPSNLVVENTIEEYRHVK